MYKILTKDLILRFKNINPYGQIKILNFTIGNTTFGFLEFHFPISKSGLSNFGKSDSRHRNSLGVPLLVLTNIGR